MLVDDVLRSGKSQGAKYFFYDEFLLAIEIVDSTAEYLGVGCINICRAFDPQVIVMTGGLALAGDQLFDKVRSWFDHHHWTIQPPTCRIVPAQTGNSAGMIGAAAAARIKFAS